MHTGRARWRGDETRGWGHSPTPALPAASCNTIGPLSRRGVDGGGEGYLKMACLGKKTLSTRSLKRPHFFLKVSRLETGEEHLSLRERMDGLQILEFMSTWRLDKDPLIPGLSKQELDE